MTKQRFYRCLAPDSQREVFSVYVYFLMNFAYLIVNEEVSYSTILNDQSQLTLIISLFKQRNGIIMLKKNYFIF